MKKRKMLKILFVVLLILAVVAGLILALCAYGRWAFNGLFHAEKYVRDSLTAEETAKLAEAVGLEPEDIGTVTLYFYDDCANSRESRMFFIAQTAPAVLEAQVEAGAWCVYSRSEGSFDYFSDYSFSYIKTYEEHKPVSEFVVYQLSNNEGCLYYYSYSAPSELCFPDDQ